MKLKALHQLREWALAHKVWSAVILVAVLGGGWYAYGAATAPSTAPSYITTNVATGTVVATLSETGQVSASQQIALAPKASGEVIGVYVKPGAKVYAGQAIAQLDATDAAQSLQNAELALKNAEITYQQTTAASTLALNLLEAQNAVTNAQVALQKAHDDTYGSIASTYSDLSALISSLDSVLHDADLTSRPNEKNIDAYADTVGNHDNSIGTYRDAAQNSYDLAVATYNTAAAAYKATPRAASDAELVALAKTTYQASEAVADAVKDTHDFYDRVHTDYTLYDLTDTGSTLATLLATTNTDTTTINADLSAALSDETAVVSAEQALAVAENTLESTQMGSNALTVQQATLSLQQAKDAVTSAQETLNNYTVVAPFSGTIAAVGVQKYDQANSGTAVATIVTDQETVDLSVNEVDAAKIAVGQKATLTFDALPGVTIAGTVATLNTIGTVSSGVVSYDLVVTLDTGNASVKPGMSASASIITGSASGLVVPASAVKTTGGASYVQVFNPPLANSSAPPGAQSATAPTRVVVTTGLASNTEVIILSGLTPGEQVVTETLTGTQTTTAKSSASQSTSVFGAGAGGGGGVRALGR